MRRCSAARGRCSYGVEVANPIGDIPSPSLDAAPPRRQRGGNQGGVVARLVRPDCGVSGFYPGGGTVRL